VSDYENGTNTKVPECLGYVLHQETQTPKTKYTNGSQKNLRHNSLDQILDGNHADDLLLVINNGQVPNSLGHHLFHARIDRLGSERRDNVGATGGNLPDGCLFRGLSEESNLANVVALTDNARHVSCCGDGGGNGGDDGNKKKKKINNVAVETETETEECIQEV
jgi:hypothetical protein